MFWRNGYEALAALDDDRNGWLEGAELKGIRVWRDVNSDGSCQPGEVASLASYDIAALAVDSTDNVLGVPANARGVRRRDGTFRPSYDWTASPAASTSR
jgi:hypothetical protein